MKCVFIQFSQSYAKHHSRANRRKKILFPPQYIKFAQNGTIIGMEKKYPAYRAAIRTLGEAVGIALLQKYAPCNPSGRRLPD